MTQVLRCPKCKDRYEPHEGNRGGGLCPKCIAPIDDRPTVSSHDYCQRCKQPIAADLDSYTIFCSTCLTAAAQSAATRQERLAAGDTNVPNMTAEERETVLSFRREQRKAITD